MADDMDFESFDNLDDLDWSELEENIKESAQEGQGQAPAGGAEAQGGAAAPTVRGSVKHIDIAYLLDVNLEVTVEVGRRQYYISEILSWDHGSIVELEKIVGEPLNLLVNNKPVAKGEVVVVNDKFALRITEIMDPHDRLQHLEP